jgi:hypothetical protein
MKIYDIKRGYGGFSLRQCMCGKNTHMCKRCGQTPINPPFEVKSEKRNPPFRTACPTKGFNHTCMVKMSIQGEQVRGTVCLTHPGFIVGDNLSRFWDVTSPSNESTHTAPFLQETVGQLRIISIHHVVRIVRNPELLSALIGGLRFPSMDILPTVIRGMT